MIGTQRDFQGLMSAIETRNTLEDVEKHRLQKAQGSDYDRPVAVPQNRTQIPIYDEKGNVFASGLVKNNFTFTIPDDLAEGTLIEYQDNKGQYYYGRVIKNDQKKAAVHSLTQKEAETYKEQGHASYRLEEAHKKEAKESAISRLLESLDPSENIALKLLSALLMFDVFERDSVTDIFMQIYLRILGLGIVIILLVYLLTYLAQG